MTPEPPSIPPERAVKAQNGSRSLKRTLIALTPAIVAHLLMAFLSGSTIEGDFWFPICIALIGIGAIIAATFVSLALRRNQIHIALRILVFIGVVIAYLTIASIGGCFAMMIGSSF